MIDGKLHRLFHLPYDFIKGPEKIQSIAHRSKFDQSGDVILIIGPELDGHFPGGGNLFFLHGQVWIRVPGTLPDDMVYDTTVEDFTILIKDLEAGEHVIALQISDDIGNTMYKTFEVDIK